MMILLVLRMMLTYMERTELVALMSRKRDRTGVIQDLSLINRELE